MHCGLIVHTFKPNRLIFLRHLIPFKICPGLHGMASCLLQWLYSEGQSSCRGSEKGDVEVPYLWGHRRGQGHGIEVVAHLCWKCWDIFLWVGECFELLQCKDCILTPCLCFQVGGFFYIHFTRSEGLAAMLYKKENVSCGKQKLHTEIYVWFLNSEFLCSLGREGLMHFFLFHFWNIKGKD